MHGGAEKYSHRSRGRRRSIRLKGYDYSEPGSYFVTICARDSQSLFGRISNGEMRLNDAGRMVDECWREIPVHFPRVELDKYVVMPDHVHGIIGIAGPVVGDDAMNKTRRPAACCVRDMRDAHPIVDGRDTA